MDRVIEPHGVSDIHLFYLQKRKCDLSNLINHPIRPCQVGFSGREPNSVNRLLSLWPPQSLKLKLGLLLLLKYMYLQKKRKTRSMLLPCIEFKGQEIKDREVKMGRRGKNEIMRIQLKQLRFYSIIIITYFDAQINAELPVEDPSSSLLPSFDMWLHHSLNTSLLASATESCFHAPALDSASFFSKELWCFLGGNGSNWILGQCHFHCDKRRAESSQFYNSATVSQTSVI